MGRWSQARLTLAVSYETPGPAVADGSERSAPHAEAFERAPDALVGGIERQRLAVFGHGAVAIALLQVDVAAVGVGAGIVRVDLDGFVEVRQRAVELALPGIGQPHVVVGRGRRLDRERLVVLTYGTIILFPVNV